MAVQVQGNSGTVAEVDGTLWRALRITNRPADYTVGSYTGGYYALSGLSGTMAAGLAANSPVFAFRWGDATRIAVIHRITLDGFGCTTAFAAGFGKFDLLMARSWTGNYSGGTSILPGANQNELRTSMGTTLLTDVRIASTGTLTAGGTPTLDTNPFGQISFSASTAASTNMLGQVPLFSTDGLYSHPYILAQNEGFIMRATVPITGVWQFGVTVSWAEMASF